MFVFNSCSRFFSVLLETETERAPQSTENTFLEVDQMAFSSFSSFVHFYHVIGFN